jgi:hypothetical protein
MNERCSDPLGTPGGVALNHSAGCDSPSEGVLSENSIAASRGSMVVTKESTQPCMTPDAAGPAWWGPRVRHDEPIV